LRLVEWINRRFFPTSVAEAVVMFPLRILCTRVVVVCRLLRVEACRRRRWGQRLNGRKKECVDGNVLVLLDIIHMSIL